jgi:two-component system, NarL family, response regulator DesR
MPSGKIRVLIAEDMHMIRGALAALLSLEPDIEVVAQVDRGTAILEAALRTKPDVAILDIGLPELDGISAAALLHEKIPECRTLVLTSYGQPGNLLRALKERVRGFLLKDVQPERLANAVRAIVAGQRVLDPELVAAAVEAGASPLTERETEVLRVAEEGLSTKEIGRRLNLSSATVRNYLSNALSKLGARNRLEALRIARNAGWL